MIEDGSQVKIHYTLTVDGDVVDSSDGRDPLSYTQGGRQIIPGLEEELIGMGEGEAKAVTVPPEKGYGVHNPEAVVEVPRQTFESLDGLEVGAMVQGQMNGRDFQARVVEIGAEAVQLDLNHPLAGKTLHFDVTVVDVS